MKKDSNYMGADTFLKNTKGNVQKIELSLSNHDKIILDKAIRSMYDRNKEAYEDLIEKYPNSKDMQASKWRLQIEIESLNELVEKFQEQGINI